MASPAAPSDAAVTYKSPIGQRVFGVIRSCFIFTILIAAVAGLFWLTLTPAIFPQQIPSWWHGIGLGALVGVFVGLGLLIRRETRSRLSLQESGVRLGGLIFSRRKPYD